MRSRREGNRGDCERAFLRLCVVARKEDVTFVEAGICTVSVELVQMVVFFPMVLLLPVREVWAVWVGGVVVVGPVDPALVGTLPLTKSWKSSTVGNFSFSSLEDIGLISFSPTQWNWFGERCPGASTWNWFGF